MKEIDEKFVFTDTEEECYYETKDVLLVNDKMNNSNKCDATRREVKQYYEDKVTKVRVWKGNIIGKMKNKPKKLVTKTNVYIK